MDSLRLLKLRFFVDHVLSHNGIILLELELVRRVGSVLRRGVEVPGSRRRLKLDLLSLTLRHGFLLFPAIFCSLAVELIRRLVDRVPRLGSPRFGHNSRIRF